MKKLLTVTAVCVATMLVIVPLAQGQGQAPPAGAPGQERPGGPPAQAAEKVFQGQLTKVDANAKAIMVKGADAEMTFEYTDATQVVGSPNIQGLAGKTGADLRVTYRDAGGKHTATKIETVEKPKD
jgi:hypothetical protein